MTLSEEKMKFVLGCLEGYLEGSINTHATRPGTIGDLEYRQGYDDAMKAVQKYLESLKYKMEPMKSGTNVR